MKMEITPTALISSSTGSGTACLSCAVAGDPSCLLHTDGDNRTRCFCCASRLKVDSRGAGCGVCSAGACPEGGCAGLGLR
jgi:hypothetical protein